MIYKVSYDSVSWGPGKRYVHIGAIIEVEAESEEEARKKARDTGFRSLGTFGRGACDPCKKSARLWITRRGRG